MQIIPSLNPEVLADRDLYEESVAQEQWAELRQAPHAVPFHRNSLCRNFELTDEQIATLVWSVARAKLNDELRNWHLMQIAATVTEAVEKMVETYAFEQALVAS